MKKTKSIFIHGFNNDHDGWKVILNPMPVLSELGGQTLNLIDQLLPQFNIRDNLEIYARDPAFKTKVIRWDSQSIGNKFLLAGRSLFDQSAIEETHRKWQAANDNISPIGTQLADLINNSIRTDGKIVIAAHSLGSCVAYEAIKKIRKDIKIFLFMMAGVAECFEYENLIDEYKNIKYALNLYNPNDITLTKMLPQMDFTIDPIGTNKLNPVRSRIACNIETNFGHSNYKNIKVRAQFVQFTHFVKKYR